MDTSGACRACGACVEMCVAGARRIAGRRVGVEELLNEVEKDLIFFESSDGGITLSGGEPLAQPRFTLEFLKAARARGIRTAIETCGYVHPEVFRSVALSADALLFDLKLVDAERHRLYTGVSNRPILRNLEMLARNGGALTVRIPVIPGVNDDDAEIDRFAQVLWDLRVPRIELLPYHRTGIAKYRRLGWTYKLPDTTPPGESGLSRFRRRLESTGLNVTVRG